MSTIVGVILAGGSGKRMGRVDKGALMLSGKRLIDHVLARFSFQVSDIVIAGRHDYDTGLPVAPDFPDGPQGPAAGLYAALHWMDDHAPGADGLVSVPVDAPFLPTGLVRRLSKSGACAVAQCEERLQPAFAYWNRDDLADYFRDGQGAMAAPALYQIVEAVEAGIVDFPDPHEFLNINRREDLERAEGYCS